MIALIGIMFGWIDESTQPIFSRVFDLLDIAADMTGVILASVLMLLIWYRNNGWQCHITPDSLAQPPADARS
jgi:VanZ family protein